MANKMKEQGDGYIIYIYIYNYIYMHIYIYVNKYNTIKVK